MYCPGCGTNNLDGARFCRSCGVDISLVPQALTGHVPDNQSVDIEDDERDRHGRRKGPPSLDKAIKNIFMGLGFIVVALILSRVPMGWSWWYWMFIPASTMLGGGVAEYFRFKQAQKDRALPLGAGQPGMAAMPPAPPRAGELPRRNTSELVMQPPSVTEGTTRLLETEAPTRHIGRAVENPSQKSPAD